MSPLFKKTAYIAAALEATYQTEPTWATTDFVQVTDLNIEPLSKSELLEVNQASYSNGETIVTVLSHKASFKVPLWACDQAAAVGTVPRYFNLLKACGMDLTTGAVANSEYTSAQPGSAAAMAANTAIGLKIMESELLMSYMGGAYGSPKLVLEYGKIPMIEFEFYGLYEAPELYSNPVTPDPWAIETLNIHPWRNVYCGIRFGAGSIVTTYVPHKVEINLGTKVVERPNATAEYALGGYLIAGRQPTMMLSFEKRILAAESATEFMIGNDMVEFRTTFGDPDDADTYATSRGQLEIPSGFSGTGAEATSGGKIVDVKDGDVNGIVTTDLTLDLGGSDDEFMLKVLRNDDTP